MREDCHFFNAVKIATKNPIDHYKLKCGLLKNGDKADFIRIDSPENLDIIETYIDGKKVYDVKEPLKEVGQQKPINNFRRTKELVVEDIQIKEQQGKIRVIEAYDKELYTGEILENTNSS